MNIRIPQLSAPAKEQLTSRFFPCVRFPEADNWRLRQTILEPKVLVACLITRSHSSFNLCDSFDGATEFNLDIPQALINSEFRFPGDQKAAMNGFLEGWFPSRICCRSSNDSWIRKSRGSCRCIGKLALGKQRITKIVRNTKLK